MRLQLQKFTDFANTLLPHETAYLLSVQQFKDEKRLEILKHVHHNAQNIEQFTPYNVDIDKRKYNHLKNWIQVRLAAIDVDEQFKWYLNMEQKIMTDTISPEEEKQLLKEIGDYHFPTFSFSKFYELVERYRHFILIRIRYNDHKLADDFLKKYKPYYLKAKETSEKIHQASVDIVGQYSGEKKQSKKWEDYLSDIFFDEKIEGNLRYLALVRLVFIAHNYREYDSLREKFDYLDGKFSEGLFYSKRHLLNYYSNRLMLHSNFKEYDQAIYYGYLSTRSITHDHLFYVNNLCAVLLRRNRKQEALQLMQKTSNTAKRTKNFHNRIGYVAFYMQALNENGMYKNAISYGDSFLKAYSKEVLQYRWHLFFSVYLEAMILQGRFESVIKVSKKYRLLEKDREYQSNAGYIPSILIYILASKFREGIIVEKDVEEELTRFFGYHSGDISKKEQFKKWMLGCKSWFPEIKRILNNVDG